MKTLAVAAAFFGLIGAGVGGHFAGKEASNPGPTKPKTAALEPPVTVDQPAQPKFVEQDWDGPPIPCDQCPNGIPRILRVEFQNISCSCAVPPGYTIFWIGKSFSGVFGPAESNGRIQYLAWGQPYVGLGWNNAAVFQCTPFRMEWVITVASHGGCTGQYRVIVRE